MKQTFYKTFLVCLFACIGQMASAYDFEVDGVYYNKIDDSSVEVTYKYASGNSYSGDFVIPSSVTYEQNVYSVTGIGESAFYNCEDMTSVTIPNSVTSIGKYAFYNCFGLTSITIPSSVTSIGTTPFGYCSSLTEIIVAADNTKYCSVNGLLLSKNQKTLWVVPAGLTSVAIPDGVERIAPYALYGCDVLASVTIPSGVTSIERGAFQNCMELTSITIPDGVTDIADYTFDGCRKLASINIPNGVTSIGSNAFYKCI